MDERLSEEKSGRRDQGCDERRPENNNVNLCEGAVIKCGEEGGKGRFSAVNEKFNEKY